MINNDVDILNFLKDACVQVKSFEDEAKLSLSKKNTEKYKEIMLAKAKFLAIINIKAQQILLSLTPSLKDIVEPELQNFASSALNALSHNSTFYMSALLFPNDHVDGEMNNLEKFTLKIEKILN